MWKNLSTGSSAAWGETGLTSSDASNLILFWIKIAWLACLQKSVSSKNIKWEFEVQAGVRFRRSGLWLESLLTAGDKTGGGSQLLKAENNVGGFYALSLSSLWPKLVPAPEILKQCSLSPIVKKILATFQSMAWNGKFFNPPLTTFSSNLKKGIKPLIAVIKE